MRGTATLKPNEERSIPLDIGDESSPLKLNIHPTEDIKHVKSGLVWDCKLNGGDGGFSLLLKETDGEEAFVPYSVSTINA